MSVWQGIGRTKGSTAQGSTGHRTATFTFPIRSATAQCMRTSRSYMALAATHPSQAIGSGKGMMAWCYSDRPTAIRIYATHSQPAMLTSRSCTELQVTYQLLG